MTSSSTPLTCMIASLELQEKVKENSGMQIFNSLLNEFLLITRKNGEILAKKLVTYHQKSDNTEVQFEMAHESDGSRRVIDLLPAFLEMIT